MVRHHMGETAVMTATPLATPLGGGDDVASSAAVSTPATVNTANKRLVFSTPATTRRAAVCIRVFPLLLSPRRPSRRLASCRTCPPVSSVAVPAACSHASISSTCPLSNPRDGMRAQVVGEDAGVGREGGRFRRHVRRVLQSGASSLPRCGKPSRLSCGGKNVITYMSKGGRVRRRRAPPRPRDAKVVGILIRPPRLIPSVPVRRSSRARAAATPSPRTPSACSSPPTATTSSTAAASSSAARRTSAPAPCAARRSPAASPRSMFASDAPLRLPTTPPTRPGTPSEAPPRALARRCAPSMSAAWSIAPHRRPAPSPPPSPRRKTPEDPPRVRKRLPGPPTGGTRPGPRAHRPRPLEWHR